MPDVNLGREVWLQREPMDEASWEDVAAAVLSVTRWSDFGGLTEYRECFRSCRFGSTDEGWQPDPTAFEGRIFGHDAEMRWVRGESGRLKVWCLREGGGDGRRVLRLDRRYYLIGKGTTEPSEFYESRYPNPFTYPVAQGHSRDPQPARDRAFVLVAEYRRLEPSWTTVGPDRLDEELDGPFLLDHRFVVVGAGMDQKILGDQ